MQLYAIYDPTDGTWWNARYGWGKKQDATFYKKRHRTLNQLTNLQQNQIEPKRTLILITFGMEIASYEPIYPRSL